MIKHLLALTAGIICAAVAAFLARGIYAQPTMTNFDTQTGEGTKSFRIQRAPAISKGLAQTIMDSQKPTTLHEALNAPKDPRVEMAWQRINSVRQDEQIQNAWFATVKNEASPQQLDTAYQLIDLDDYALAATSKVPPQNWGHRWYDIPTGISSHVWQGAALATVKAVKEGDRELAQERLGWLWAFHNLQSAAVARCVFGGYGINIYVDASPATFLGLIQATQEYEWFQDMLVSMSTRSEAEEICRKASAATWLDQQIAFGQDMNGHYYSTGYIMKVHDRILNSPDLESDDLYDIDQDRLANLKAVIIRDRALSKLVERTVVTLLTSQDDSHEIAFFETFASEKYPVTISLNPYQYQWTVLSQVDRSPDAIIPEMFLPHSP